MTAQHYRLEKIPDRVLKKRLITELLSVYEMAKNSG